MSEIQVATRYAKSILDLAEEQGSVEAISESVSYFLRVCKANSELRAVLKNPIVSPDKKIAILNQVFGPNVPPLILSFFKIVVSKGRAQVLYATAKEFVNLYNIKKGIVKATVTSAAPLSEENKREIESVVRETVKGEIVLQTKVNPSLIGGFVLQVGDKQFDTSISSRLQKLKKEFSQKVVA
jgi:F-type H+-transporting ATPase subunit delta